jgi:hypothetical protein
MGLMWDLLRVYCLLHNNYNCYARDISVVENDIYHLYKRIVWPRLGRLFFSLFQVVNHNVKAFSMAIFIFRLKWLTNLLKSHSLPNVKALAEIELFPSSCYVTVFVEAQ